MTFILKKPIALLCIMKWHSSWHSGITYIIFLNTNLCCAHQFSCIMNCNYSHPTIE